MAGFGQPLETLYLLVTRKASLLNGAGRSECSYQ